jgi:DNA-binding PucR family transcriptional regulator
MLLRDLVDDPDLGLTLLHGADALDRSFTAVFTTDLLDPRRYLAPDVLVLTGLMWRRDPADSDSFVRALADAKVVALAAGEAAFGVVPDDVVQACRRHDVALVRVPVEVSFGRISDAVAAEHETEQGRLLATALGRQRRLLSAVADGRSLDELLALVGSDLGLTCRVLTTTGRQVAASDGPLGEADVDLISRTYLLADRLPATVELSDGSLASIVAVESRLEQRLISWFLVCDGDHRHWPDDVPATLGELASVVTLEHHRWDEARRYERRIADEVIALVATGQSSRAEVAVRITDLGADPDGPFVVAAAARTEDSSGADATHAVLHDAGLQVAEHPVTGVQAGRAVTLLTTTPAASHERLRTLFNRLAAGIGRGRLAVGLSAGVNLETLTGALDEALHAVRLAELRDDAVSVVTSDEIASHVLLLGTVPDDVRRAFARRVLGRVLDYDAQHGGDLLPTVDAFLQADGSWTRCARALHVHANTVRYRIQRVEEFTGRDLSRLEDRVDVFLALHALRS